MKREIKPLVLVFSVVGLMVAVVGILFKYGQIARQIEGLEADKQEIGANPNVELVLRSSAKTLHRGDYTTTDNKLYRSAG